MDNLGALKLAAIDAAMKLRGYDVSEAGYTVRLPGMAGEVTRPSSDSSDGGQVLWFKTYDEASKMPAKKALTSAELKALSDDLVEEFDSIRSSINAMFAPWHSAPQPSDFTSVEGKCDRLVALMMGSTTESGNAVTAGGELGAAISSLNMSATRIAGGAFDVFVKRYITDTAERAIRLTGLAEVLGQVVQSERKIWTEVEADLNSLITKFTEEFNSLAKGNSASVELTFAVIGAALEGASLVVPGVAVAKVSLNLAQAISSHHAKDATETNASFGFVSEGLEGLRAALKDLSSRIHDEEGLIITGITEIDSDVRANSDLFQLSAAPSNAETGTEHVVTETAMSIATFHLPDVIDGLTVATQQLTPLADILRADLDRDYTVGNRTDGAAPEFEGIANLLKSLLNELAFDLDNGARKLKTALTEWAEHEEQARQRFIGFESEISATHNGRPVDDMLDNSSRTTTGHRKPSIYELMGAPDPTKQKGPVK